MANPTLEDLEGRDDFVGRHIGPTEGEQAEMLAAIGVASLAELIDQAVPTAIRSDAPLDLPGGCTEAEVIARLADLAESNEVLTSLIGMGYHDTHTPPVILRNVLECPGWYTAYTPYQPEISQGRLEALLNFQTMVADLTAMELANASLLDEGTAAAEAMAMCGRLNPDAGPAFFVDRDCHPQTIDVVSARAAPLDIEVTVGDPLVDIPENGVFGALLQYPGSSGEIRDDEGLVAALHDRGTLVAVAADLLALVLLRPPGEIGADVVVGSSQRFGVPLAFGGPHAAYLAAKKEHRRTLPGRLVGVSVDAAGREALRLALQTREQHIRREKATSNICTAQVLLAVMAGLYATYHGPEGLRRIAERVHRVTGVLAAGLTDAGIHPVNENFFDTLTVRVPGRADEVLAAARDRGINLRPIDADTVGISFDETSGRRELEALFEVFGLDASVDALDRRAAGGIPEGLRRESPILAHPVFGRYQNETAMMRYLRRLADRDIALDRSMIPLGSCTMKLNAATEMLPITWRGFSGLHPFAPSDQAAGYHELIDGLEGALCEITGYDAVSMQPNAGSQGEFAGLLAIRRFHEANGDDRRDICLIPASAHGTNAASAAVAGLRVVVVDCDEHGNIDFDDLKRKADTHAEQLSALMVTYPSTHGVFEARICDVCEVVHEYGGQVYLDGANLNALVGVAKPGHFGADVSHLNLHKTFCIPHGGGGPGVGPIGVRRHLAPFLPTHNQVPEAGPENGLGVISSAPWGSAGILPISWAYITLMGAAGLTRATEVAILAANYVATRLAPHFPVLYSGRGGMVAHECILDLRPLTSETGVTVDDVAKRLIDYGFHAPTMSFPVPGTLMVEPTESEDKAELDRFCDAMIAIRDEIRRVGSGELDPDDNPLRNAPHTADDVTADDWSHPYSREEAAYPVTSLREAKYWAPVGRIDGAFGDRHLQCSCPPVSAYAT